VFVAVIVKTFVTVKFATDIFKNDAAPTTDIVLRVDAPVTFRDPVFADLELIYGVETEFDTARFANGCVIAEL